MKRYHISPKTGEPGLCKATKSCPFGDMVKDHYPSVAAAQAGYEARMQYVTTPRLGRLKTAPTVALHELMPLELLDRMRGEAMVDVKPHEDDEQLKILCYTRNAQYAGAWNEVTKTARGLIVRADEDNLSDGLVIERPWRKFFSLEQHDAGWALGDEENPESAADNLKDLDFSAPAEVTDKMDGSMGVLYLHPDGRPALSTKGSFGSDQAVYYTRMLRNGALGEEAAYLLAREKDKTFLFEMIGKDNRIVLDYPEDGIVLLGAVEKQRGLYLSANDYADRWSGGVTETMQAATVADALALPDRAEREGVVIRVLTDDPAKQMQLKVKQDDYKVLHRAITQFSKNDMRVSIRESTATMTNMLEAERTGDMSVIPGVREHMELIGSQPGLERITQERGDAYREVIMPRLKKLRAAKDYVDALPDSAFAEKDAAKKFAASIAQEKTLEKSDLFNFFQARATGYALDELNIAPLLRRLAQDM